MKEHMDGETRIKTYNFPRADIPKGVPVWRDGKKPPKLGPGEMMVMEMTMDAVFHKCEDCGTVWQKPHQHTRRECQMTVVTRVMDS